MRAEITVFLKDGVLDSQGKAVEHALGSLGFGGVESVRIGKQIVIELAEQDRAKAQESVSEMCESLLANTVIEDYEIEIVE